MKVKVVRQMRLGNVTEDVASVPSTGNLLDLVILEGYEVLRIRPPQKVPDPVESPVERLCDLLNLDLTGAPKGLTYSEMEKLFVVNSGNQPTTLFLFDETGRPRGIRTIQRPDFTLNHVEGLAYLPPKSPHYPDHIVLVAVNLANPPDLQSRLEIIDRDGQITAAIFQQPEHLTGVTFKAPDSLLVSRADDDLVREIDFQGNIIRESKTTSDIFGGQFQEIEGLAQLRNGAIAAVNFFLGKLAFLDRDLNLTAAKDVDFQIGPGLFEIGALAWDSMRSQHLLISYLRDNNPPGLPLKRYISEVQPGRDAPATEKVPPMLNPLRRIVDVDDGTVRMTYLPDERLIAVSHQEDPKGSIRLFDERGTMVEEIFVTAIGRPAGIAYVPTTHQFVVRFAGTKALTFLTRKGEFVRKVDLSATVKSFNGFAFFNPGHSSGGQFVFLNTPPDGDALITDLNANRVDTFKPREAAIASTNISAITTGPDAGAFAILDEGNNALVVFRLI